MAFIRLESGNFFHNLSQLALKAGRKERLAVVLKDNAYGHGLEEIAALAAQYGITEAVVISNDEAGRIREYFENILVLNDVPTIDRKCSYAVSTLEILSRVDPAARLELKVDTGMHRNGISPDELGRALEIIRKRKLNLFGVMTHYRSADVLSSELYWQRKRFEEIKTEVRKRGFGSVRFHSCNTAALLRSRDFDEEIARVGIGIYGYHDLPKIFGTVDLRPVLSLWARRVSTRKIGRGERIGYAGVYEAEREMIVSTYDLGYADGWPRGDAAVPYVTPGGFPLLGRVSMDFVSLEGDAEEICIMDDARKAARHFGTICYEMTAGLRETLPKMVIEKER